MLEDLYIKVQVANDDKKREMYRNRTKEDLIELLIQANKVIDVITKKKTEAEEHHDITKSNFGFDD